MARIFISYSHQDEAFKPREARPMTVLAPKGLALWDDWKIRPGDPWDPAIAAAIAVGAMALLLVAAHFLTSPFILGEEVPPPLQHRQAQDLPVIPVILSPCPWHRSQWLESIQACQLMVAWEYGRRLPDLEDAERAAGIGPSS